MKTRVITLIGLFLLTIIFYQKPVSAQEVKDDEKKEIIIERTTIDENGNKKVEKIVRRGEGTAHYDVNVDGDFEGKDVEVQVEHGEDGKLIIRKIVNGEVEEKIIDQKEIERAYHFDGDNVMIFSDGNNFRHREHEIACDRPFLGVVIEGNSGGGLLVKEVFETSGAEAAGIKLGDVLKSIDGTELNSISDLSVHLSERKAGDRVSLVVQRGEETVELSAGLQERQKKDAWDGLYRNFWIAIKDRVPEEETRTKAFMGVYLNEGDEGVQITGTSEGSGAAAAGIQGGDRFVSIGGRAINKGSDISAALAEFEPGQTIDLVIDRDGQQQRMNLTLGEREIRRMHWIGCDEDKQGAIEEELIKRKIIIMEREESPETEEEEPAEEVEPAREFVNVSPSDFEGNRLEVDEWSAYPNPTGDVVNVVFEAAEGPLTVTAVDASGKQIFEQNYQDFDGYFADRINLREAITGTVLIMVRQGDRIFSEKIVKN